MPDPSSTELWINYLRDIDGWVFILGCIWAVTRD